MADEPLAPFGDATVALRAGDWLSARRAFEAALALNGSGACLEGLARACYGLREYPEAIDAFERAFVAYRREANAARAAYIAGRWLTFIHGAVEGSQAVAGGWFQRAQSILEEAGDVVERGWVDLALVNMTSDDVVREAAARNALEIAQRFDDPDLESCARACVGECLVFAGRPLEGMVLIDEALAACSSGEVSDFVVVGEIYCKLFGACERTVDAARAEEWLAAVDDLSQRRNLTGFSGICRTHYGGILIMSGRWSEAEEELHAAIRAFKGSYRALAAEPVLRLADLRVRQGRTDEATHLLSGLDRRQEAARPLAAIHASRGEYELARDVLERALAAQDMPGAVEAALVVDLVDVLLGQGEIASARRGVERLDEIVGHHGGNYVKALTALARARLCVATGTGAERACFEEAVKRFVEAQMPLELGEARLELARSLSEDRPQVAIAEAKLALDSFERLEAARHVDSAAALLRSLGAAVPSGPRSSGALTKRETEVLELLGHGHSNKEIADRLVISTRTAEHHVSRILTKLGLKSRAEAAAHATRAQRPP